MERSTSWRSKRMLPLENLPEDLRALRELSEGERPINSMIKLRLYPTTSQRAKLEQMFATKRAVYNKMAARSKEDCATRLVLRGKGGMLKKMTLRELGNKCRPASQTRKMGLYFHNNKNLQRHLEVHDEVRDSAFRDFTEAVKSSLVLYFTLKKKDKKITFPELKCKSKFARSNTIELHSRNCNVVHKNEKDFLQFHPMFLGFEKRDGIKLRETPPELIHSVRLQRLREGEYYIVVPRFVEFFRTLSSRVCETRW